MNKQPTVYLNQKEYYAIQMALGNLLEDLRSEKTQKIDWKPDARKDLDEIITAASTAAAKIHKITGIDASLPDYEEGDDKKYINPQS